MNKKCLLVMLNGMLIASPIAAVPVFSETPSVSEEQVSQLISQHSFTEKELKYKAAFLNVNAGPFDKLISHFHDPDADGVLSSKAKIKEKIAECNIISYQAYDEELRAVPFNVVDNGGSYPDAKMAFDSALGEKMEALGREKTLSMIQGAAMIVKACTDSYGIYLFE
jgi:hypothetical protein